MEPITTKDELIDHVLKIAVEKGAQHDVDVPFEVDLPSYDLSHLSHDEQTSLMDDIDEVAVARGTGLRVQKIPSTYTVVHFYVALRH